MHSQQQQQQQQQHLRRWVSGGVSVPMALRDLLRRFGHLEEHVIGCPVLAVCPEYPLRFRALPRPAFPSLAAHRKHVAAARAAALQRARQEVFDMFVAAQREWEGAAAAAAAASAGQLRRAGVLWSARECSLLLDERGQLRRAPAPAPAPA
ncbi:MAG: hypothetical protein ACK4ZJ_20010, partial [Allorhizobium sp.]